MSATSVEPHRLSWKTMPVGSSGRAAARDELREPRRRLPWRLQRDAPARSRFIGSTVGSRWYCAQSSLQSVTRGSLPEPTSIGAQNVGSPPSGSGGTGAATAAGRRARRDAAGARRARPRPRGRRRGRRRPARRRPPPRPTAAAAAAAAAACIELSWLRTNGYMPMHPSAIQKIVESFGPDDDAGRPRGPRGLA